MLQPVLTVLQVSNLSGSVEISGRCDLQFLPDLPPVRPTADNMASPLSGLRELFADDSAMQIRQDPSGLIRMNEVGVPKDILNIRISHISFESDGQNALYNPNDALRAILQTSEVATFIRSHAIRSPNAMEAVTGSTGRWPAQWPHISGSLNNVTMEQALDHVLKTFPGIWLYEDCPKADKRNRVAYFRFFFLRKIGSSTPVVEE